MNIKYRFVPLALVVLATFAACGFAEDDYEYNRFDYSIEVFGAMGVGSWYSDEAGILYGGGFVFRPYPKAGFEITFRRLTTLEESSFGLSDRWWRRETGNTLTASVHYYFSDLRYQPYLLLGGGYAGTHTSNYYDFEGMEVFNEWEDHSFVIEAGGGVEFFLSPKWSIRPDVRLLIGSPGSMQGSINLCYHW